MNTIDPERYKQRSAASRLRKIEEDLSLPSLLIAPNDLRALQSTIVGYLPYLRRLPRHDQGTVLVLESLQRRLTSLLAYPERLKGTPIILSQAEVAVAREALLGFCTLLPLIGSDTPGVCVELVARLMHLYERLGEMQQDGLD